ncbi:unnamed protein product [Heligmosomoides polygyrus]|uniref:Uncharacterized protein n=1 Tax=Heligmosomoides polygyrus TaxID=6339 RepID=A0A3P7Y5I9_HELPZ|nr:unnamed protein product [Heligmosomoides polygyrus]
MSRTYSDCSVPRKRHRHSTSDHRFREEAHPCYAGFNNTAPRLLYFQAVLIIGWPAPDIFTRVVVTCILRSRLIVCTLR